MEWKFYAFASAFFAGLTAVLAKMGLVSIPSNMATLVRTCIVIIFLIFLVTVRREWINPFVFGHRGLACLVLSGIATGLSWSCYFRALQIGPASLVVPIDKLSLVFAIIFSLVFLGEQLTLLQWGGVVLIGIGVLLMIVK